MEMFIAKKTIRKCALKNYISQIRGVSYKPADLRSPLSADSVLLLRANNINANQINHDDVQYVSSRKVSEAQLIRGGDILMCASSGSLEHVGKSALCSSLIAGETFGAFCKLIRPIGELCSEYIAAYLETDECRDKVKKLACGSNINNLKNEHIDDLQIPVPTMDAQLQFTAIVKQSDKSKHLLEICPFF